jgi:NAD(P)H dehydrogenase (quinone)
MSVVVTGATGHFGRLAIEALIRRGVPAQQIVAVGRNVGVIADLAERGVVVRRADYTDPAALRAAFAGGEKLLFVSGSEAGRRVPQHRGVIAAAKEAGIGLVAYTSILHADTSSLILAEEHRQTERDLLAAGLPYVLLRNGWYFENWTGNLAATLEHGLVGAAGDGRFSAAARADLAEAAAAVLTSDGHEHQTYELGGAPFTLTELAAVISAESGREVRYTDLPAEKLVEILVGAGLPEALARVLADADRGATTGQLEVEGNDLEKLIGRPPTSVTDAVRAALG